MLYVILAILFVVGLLGYVKVRSSRLRSSSRSHAQAFQATKLVILDEGTTSNQRRFDLVAQRLRQSPETVGRLDVAELIRVGHQRA